MRKKLIRSDLRSQPPEGEWINLGEVAQVEVSSEHPNFPIESALTTDTGPGWRAAEPGEQTIRIVFDKPTTLRRVRIEFSETEIERIQEFTLRWSDETDGPFREVVRQQWNFSPQGSTREVEDYRLHLENVLTLELTLKPDLFPRGGLATLAKWRVA
jgi:hypothetical protein